MNVRPNEEKDTFASSSITNAVIKNLKLVMTFKYKTGPIVSLWTMQ